MIRPPLVVVLVALAGLPALAPVSSGTTEPCTEREDFEPVEGLGLACWTGEHWAMLLEDGTTVAVHVDATAAPLAGDLRRPPVCVEDPTTQRHGLLVYARSVGEADGYETHAPRLREDLERANAILWLEATRYGAQAALVVRCDEAGVPVVLHVVLPDAHSFNGVYNGMRNAGHASSLVKYWIFANGGSPGAGVANVPEADASPGPSNLNNGGPDYGIEWSHDGGLLLHEITHTLGGVQGSAPHRSANHHCTDESDLMCYDDGAGFFYACKGHEYFDCRGDDYFNPRPYAGSWLATHWNLASGASDYVRAAFSSPVPAAPELVAQPGPGAGQATLTWTPDAWPGGGEATGWRVYWRHGWNLWSEHLMDVPGGETSRVIDGLGDGRTYDFFVAGTNAAGEGGRSWNATVTTFARPGAPQNLTATSGVQKVNLVWNPSPDDGGTAVTEWVAIMKALPSGPSTERVLRPGALPGGKLNAVVWMEDTGTYEFRVVAANLVGRSSPSNAAISGALSG